MSLEDNLKKILLKNPNAYKKNSFKKIEAPNNSLGRIRSLNNTHKAHSPKLLFNFWVPNSKQMSNKCSVKHKYD